MPSQKATQSYNNKSIKDFFKPFTIPKSRIPINNVVEEEIVVAAPRVKSPTPIFKKRQSTASPTKRSKPPRYTSSPLSSALSSPLRSNVSTPKKERPTKATPSKRSRIMQLDGAADGDLMHSSPSSSQRRVMTAVAIPSPQSPPPLPPPTTEQPVRAATTSFSSISSFSSVPMSTQSSSKRVMKNGMHAVTNSDSGSEDSDSSDELADPSTFMPQKRRKLTPPGQDKEHAVEIPSTVKPSGRQSKRLSDRTSTATTPTLRRSPPRPVYKHSLMSMAKQREKQETADAKVRDMEAAFEEATRRRQAERQLDAADVQNGMKAAVADDSDEGERMMLAMERTEALEGEEKFFYFRGIGKSGKKEDTLAPLSKRPRLDALLSNERARNQAFLTGFVAQFVAMEPVDHEFYCWMAGQLIIEPRRDLCEAYVQTLRAATTHPFDKGGWGQYGDLSNYYNILDPSTEKRFNGLREGMERAQTRALNGTPPGLRHVLHVVEACCARIPASIPYWTAITLYELALANIDEHVRKDAGLQLAVQETIENILNHLLDFGPVLPEIHSAFFDWNALPVPLQCRAIAALPAYSRRTHEVRRMLSLHLCAHGTYKHDYVWDINSTSLLDGIVARLKHDSEFAITESTDYNLLASLISVLDIAIDAGFSSHSSTMKTSAGTTTAPINPSSSEQTFNAQIDSLISPLRRISSRIRDAGTSHLKRTEAKGAIERLIVRLEHSVRTKPKGKKGVFGDGEQKAFLSGFLEQATAGALEYEDPERVSVVHFVNEQELS